MSTISTLFKAISENAEIVHKYAFKFTDGEKYRFINKATGKAISSIFIDSTQLQSITKAIIVPRALPGELEEHPQVFLSTLNWSRFLTIRSYGDLSEHQIIVRMQT